MIATSIFGSGEAPYTRPAAQSPSGPNPVDVELFTSEVCSSCPPADKLLSQLSAKSGANGVELVALGQHVDYWDYLGRRDPFSSPAATQRQTAYGQHFRLNSIYSPQMVVNGDSECLGSSPTAARDAISTSAKAPKGRVNVTVGAQSGREREVRVKLSDVDVPAGAGTLVIAVTEADLVTEVKRGENGGRRVAHAPVVRSLSKVRTLLAGAASTEEAAYNVNINPTWQPANLLLVVFVQGGVARKTVGVGAATLP